MTLQLVVIKPEPRSSVQEVCRCCHRFVAGEALVDDGFVFECECGESWSDPHLDPREDQDNLLFDPVDIR